MTAIRRPFGFNKSTISTSPTVCVVFFGDSTSQGKRLGNWQCHSWISLHFPLQALRVMASILGLILFNLILKFSIQVASVLICDGTNSTTDFSQQPITRKSSLTSPRMPVKSSFSHAMKGKNHDIFCSIINSRKRYKMLKGATEAVWPPELEEAMLKGMICVFCSPFLFLISTQASQCINQRTA